VNAVFPGENGEAVKEEMEEKGTNLYFMPCRGCVQKNITAHANHFSLMLWVCKN
jgi:hypothetical protein